MALNATSPCQVHAAWPEPASYSEERKLGVMPSSTKSTVFVST